MESFLVAVNAVIPFFCFLALGYTMKIRGVVSEEFLQKLNQMVFRVFCIMKTPGRAGGIFLY